MNLYKINMSHTGFIMCGHHGKLYARHFILLLGNMKLFFTLRLVYFPNTYYVSMCSESKCIYCNHEKIRLCDFNNKYVFGKTDRVTPDFFSCKHRLRFNFFPDPKYFRKICTETGNKLKIKSKRNCVSF